MGTEFPEILRYTLYAFLSLENIFVSEVFLEYFIQFHIKYTWQKQCKHFLVPFFGDANTFHRTKTRLNAALLTLKHFVR